MFTHVPAPITEQAIRQEIDGKRLYLTPSGKHYPSITSVLASYGKAGLDQWRATVGHQKAAQITAKAAIRGTSVHSTLEKFLNNDPLYMEGLFPQNRAIIQRLTPVLRKNVNNIRCLETALYTDELRLAGTVDCVADWGGLVSVIDFKTARKLKQEKWIENYYMQIAAYTTMFEERTGIRVDQGIILIGVEEENFPQIFTLDRAKLHHYKKMLILHIIANLSRKHSLRA